MMPVGKNISLAWLANALCYVSLSAFTSGVITHQPVVQHQLGAPFIVYAMVSSDVDVEDVRLLYRRVGESGFIEESMLQYGDMWRGEIPETYLTADGIQYFIASTLTDGTILTFPPEDAESAPLQAEIVLPPPPPEEIPEVIEEEVTTEQPMEETEGNILIFGPTPGAMVPFDDVYIAASLFNVDSIDVSSVRLFIDGRDVTVLSDVGVDMVTYSPPAVTPGEHRIRIEAKTVQGKLVRPEIWSFRVAKKRAEEVERELTFRGRMSSDYSLDQFEASSLAVGRVGGSISGDWRWLNFNTELKVTTEEDPLKQPKNRFRLRLNAGRYFAMNLGDFNSRLSPFTLDGKRVRGVDADLRLGWVNLHLVKGELDRVIQGQLDANKSMVYDTLSVEQDVEDTTRNNLIYKFDRKGYTFQKDIFALRLTFGQGKIFQLGFNWLKTKDRIASVDPVVDDARITLGGQGADYLGVAEGTYSFSELQSFIADADRLSPDHYQLELPENDWVGNKPQDNIVAGTDFQLNLFRKHLSFQGGVAISMLNKNIWDGPITLAGLDTLLDDSTDDYIGRTYDSLGTVIDQGISVNQIPVDPADFEDWFVMNQYMVPLIPIDLDSALLADDPVGAVLGMPSLAYNLKFSARFLKNGFSFEYAQVGPEFNSLGNPYLQKNNREFTVSDRIRLLRNKLFVNLSYKHQDDNILRTVTNVTTTNTFSASIGVFPGPGLPSVNLSFRSQDRDNGRSAIDTLSIEADSLGSVTSIEYKDIRDFTNLMNTTVGINHQASLLGLNHTIAVNYVLVDKADQVKDRPVAPHYKVFFPDDSTAIIDTTFSSPDLASSVTTVSLTTEYPFPLRTTVVLSLNNTGFGKNNVDGIQDISRFNISASYGLLGGRLKLLGSLNYTSGAGRDEFRRFGVRGGFNYKVMENLSTRFDGEFRSKDGVPETHVRASLSYKF